MPVTRPIDRWLIDEVLPHEARYRAVARRLMRNDDEAADLVQEALVRLLAVDGWAAISNPRAYVVRSIHNIAVERMRRAKVVMFEQIAQADTIDLCDESPDAFRVAAGRHEMDQLRKAVDALPERCRIVFVRRRFREQSPTEIASELGISLSTFEKRLARALYLLVRALNPVEKEPDCGAADQDGNDRAIG
jgi:RNA polymerase sigma-70 factor (ECF subfamily)